MMCEKDIKAGRVRDANEFIKELEEKKDVKVGTLTIELEVVEVEE